MKFATTIWRKRQHSLCHTANEDIVQGDWLGQGRLRLRRHTEDAFVPHPGRQALTIKML